MQRQKPKKEFDEVLLEVRRVTRVTTWGRRMSFRATILVGNKKGKIWVWSAKGADVSIAVQKATHEAYKNIFIVPVASGNTVPYPVTKKFKSAIVKLLPASAGTGMKAGSSVRSVLELAGYENMLSKITGSNNKLNNALATIYALAWYKYPEHFSATKKNDKDVVDSDKKNTTDKKDVVKVKETNNSTDAVKSTTTKKSSTVEKKATVKKTSTKADPKKPVSKKAPVKKVAKNTEK